MWVKAAQPPTSGLPMQRARMCDRPAPGIGMARKHWGVCETGPVLRKPGVNPFGEKRYELESFGRQVFANSIQRPVTLSGRHQESCLEKNAHVVRHSRLRQAEDAFQFTNAESPHAKETDDTRPRLIAQRSRNCNHVHGPRTVHSHHHSPIISSVADLEYVDP